MSPVRDDEMGTALPQTDYQCEQCGDTNFVAAPVVYSQGTRSFSGRLGRGITQSSYAISAAPPHRQHYLRPLIQWGPAIAFFALWSFIGLGSALEFRTITGIKVGLDLMFIALCAICVGGLLAGLRKAARYNREVYPRLFWNWEHTYVCKRCGRFQMISS